VTGYLKPPLNLLYPDERIFLQSAYCSICKELSRRKLLINRILLNYDSLFFYILFLLANPSYSFHISPFFCSYTLTNRYYLIDNGLIKYFADYSTLFSSLKFLDDYFDEKPFKSKFSFILFKTISKSLSYINQENLKNIKAIKYRQNNEIERLIKFFEEILPLDYVNYSFRNSISIIISNLIKLLFYIDAIDDFNEDFKNKKQNIFFDLNDAKLNLNKFYLNNIKLKDNSILLEKIKKECTFSLNYALKEIENLPNKYFSHIIEVYFTDLIPALLNKSLLKNNCPKIF